MPSPAPDVTVKKMTETAGCMGLSEFVERGVEPAQESVGLRDGVGEAADGATAWARVFGRGGRYLLTGRVSISGIRSMPPRSATSRETRRTEDR
jgi:hypothetical protein